MNFYVDSYIKKPNTHILVLDCKPEQPCFKNLMLKAATTGIGFQGKKKLFVYIEAIWTIPKVYYFSTPYWKAIYTNNEHKMT